MRKSFFFSLLTLFSLKVFAIGEFAFVKNLGQFHSNVEYFYQTNSSYVFFENSAITYQLYETPEHENHHLTSKKQTLKSFAFKTKFIGANQNPEFLESKKLKQHNNYFYGKDPNRWASNVPLFQEIQYSEVYKGIDLRVSTENGVLKYDWIVKENADPNEIQLKYDGLKKLHLKNEELYIETPLGEIIEMKPFTYQVVNGEKVEVKCQYKIKKNQVSFEILEDYDKNLELIIDPTVVFATYTGSTADNFGFTATYDNEGNMYAGGTVYRHRLGGFSNSGTGFYPTTTGVVDTIFSGGEVDLGITKYSSDGLSVLYSTYLGGNGDEYPASLIADNNSNLYILGRTSSSDFPVDSGAFQTNLKGGFDIFVTKLSSNGSGILGSTYLGGSSSDGINISNDPTTIQSLKFNFGDSDRGDIFLDKNEQVYITSCSRSTNFPIVNGFQTSLSGSQDAIVAKLSNDLSQLKFSTFLGGSDDEAGYSIKVLKNHIYVCGGTNSSDFITTSGAYQALYNGNIDGFVTRIDTFTNLLDASTFVGTSAYDQTYFLDFSRNGSVFLFGQTSGSYPVTSGVYSDPNSGQFIQEISSDLSTAGISTVFGRGDGNPDISPTAFLVDSCGTVYISGWGGPLVSGTNLTTNGLPTFNATQSTTDGRDFYILVFSENLTVPLYGSFFGGNLSRDHVDGGTSRFDKKGVIYQAICGGCGGRSDFPLTPGASNNNSSNCNLLALKVDVGFNFVTAEYTISPSFSGCVPLTIDFNNESNSNNVIWNFAGLGTSTDTTPTFTFVNPGDYDVTLYAIDSLSCNLLDSVTYTVEVFPLPIITNTPDQTICKGESIQLNASGGTSYSWHPGNSLSDSTIANPIATPKIPTTYTVYVYNDENCYDSTFITIDLYAQSPISLTPDTSVCKDDSFTVFINGVSSVNWQPSNLFQNTSIFSQQISLKNSVIIYASYTDSASDCTYDTSFQISVDPLASFNVSDNFGCKPFNVQYQNTSTGATSYFWQFGDGHISFEEMPTHTYENEGIYEVTLIAENSICSDTFKFKQITVDGENPAIYIPNVFTPNGDGINDKFKVSSYIAPDSYELVIYNRWGQKVFESTSVEDSWDGKFQGNDVPEGAYVYILKIKTCSSRDVKGVVTLIR